MFTDRISERPNKDQWATLGVIRFLLALCVFFQHVSWVDVSAREWHNYSGGFSAVISFLMISGFSIAHSMNSGTRGYYARRAWRIFPAYLCVIAFALFINRDITPLTAVGSILMLQQIAFYASASLEPTWTLGPEWWFYMGAPRLTTVTAAIIALISFCYANVAWLGGVFFSALHLPGALLALAWPWLVGFCYYRTRNKNWIIVAIVGYAILHGLAAFFTTHSMATIMNVGGLGLILTLFALSNTSFAAIGALGDYLGRLSYTLYIAHAPVLVAMKQSAAPWYICLAVVLAGSLALERVEFVMQSFAKRDRHR